MVFIKITLYLQIFLAGFLASSILVRLSNSDIGDVEYPSIALVFVTLNILVYCSFIGGTGGGAG